MSAIPSNLARVPIALSSQVLLANITRTNVRILTTQVQLASGLRINRVSDDAAGASLVNALQDAIEAREQRMANFDHAQAFLDVADSALGEATDIVLQAKEIASSMVGLGADAETRRNQAQVLQSMIEEMVAIANRQYNGTYLFGGSQTGTEPFEELLGGFRYTGLRDDLQLDFGSTSAFGVTMSANDAFGSLSTRVQGDRDLSPALTTDVRVSDLGGARGLGITPGSIELDLNGLGTVDVDLSTADSVGDVIDLIDDAIAQFEAANSVTLLDAGRVGINATANGIAIDAAAGVTITVNEIGAGVTGADLGLAQAPFTDADPDGEDIDPRVTDLTLLSNLSGVGVVSDLIITNAGQTRTILASTATTVQDLSNLIQQAGIGVRLEISEDGKRINMVNEVSGGRLSIAEDVGGTFAEALGIRTFAESTLLADFNDGRGVDDKSGGVDPVTGLPDPTLDLDFRITLSDGTSFDVDITGAETVQEVIDAVTAAAPATFTIDLQDGASGFLLTDSSGGAGTFAVTSLNGARTAEDLGILQTVSSATIAGEDRATVRVEGVISDLLALRDALLANDSRGITFAGGDLEDDVDRLAQARAILGQRAGRVGASKRREEDQQLLDINLKSQMQDLDYAEASVRFSTLQAQLQAALISGAQAGNLSLLQFLG